MKVIDLTHSSKHKINAEINHFCGGKSVEKFWLTGFQKGLGGFSFTDPQSDGPDEKFMASLAFFNTGLGGLLQKYVQKTFWCSSPKISSP
ncbi:MAG: hypothetical protein IPO45_15050 [Saprospiraceae bacterium]|nr:hypothetical protein [Candidatus Brachybacter algidus]